MARHLLPLCLCVAIVAVAAVSAAASEPKKSDKKDTGVDLYGDPLLPGALARMGTVRLRHHDMILKLAVSPDGKLAASAGGDWDYHPHQVIRLWDVVTGKELRQFVGHKGAPDNVVLDT